MGNYRYKETISTNPLVDRYELNGKSIYALMMPTEQNKSVVYYLNVSKSSAWKICAPKIDSNSMDTQAVDNSAGALKLTVTETPVFVVPASLVGSVRQ
jgi:endoglucanase